MHLPTNITVALLAVLTSAGTARAQDTVPSPRVDGVRLGIVGGVTVGAFLYGHVLTNDLWWKGERSAFHWDWEHDWTYALGADKLGHMWFPYAVTHGYRRLLTWSGLDTATAVWSAASLAMTYQTYIEIRDGFSKDWGFSWGDFAADLVGAGLPVAQHYIPELALVDLKISFWPSEKFRSGSNRVIIDDYESTRHWLTLHVARALPESWGSVWPGFIDLAIGHGVADLDGLGGGRHEIYLALDWNLDELGGDWLPWNLLRDIVRHYHLPAPTVRVWPGPVVVGVGF